MPAPSAEPQMAAFLELLDLRSLFLREVRWAQPSVKALGELISLSTESIIRARASGQSCEGLIRDFTHDVVIPLTALQLLKPGELTLTSETVFADLLKLHRVLLSRLLA